MELAAVGAAALATRVYPPKADPDMYLDPIYVLFKLAELNFLPEGTLLEFYACKITFSYPTFLGVSSVLGMSVQGMKRTGVNCLWEGASSDYLHLLSPPLASVAKLIGPTAQDQAGRLFLLLAWRGCYLLSNAYDARDQAVSRDYLRGKPLLHLEEILKGQQPIIEAIEGHEEQVKHSIRYWRTNRKTFSQVQSALVEACARQAAGWPQNSIDDSLQAAKAMLRTYATSFANPGPNGFRCGIGSDVYIPDYEAPLVTVFQLNGMVNEQNLWTYHRCFWDWFEQPFKNDAERNNGKWFARMGIASRTADWLCLRPLAVFTPQPSPPENIPPAEKRASEAPQPTTAPLSSASPLIPTSWPPHTTFAHNGPPAPLSPFAPPAGSNGPPASLNPFGPPQPFPEGSLVFTREPFGPSAEAASLGWNPFRGPSATPSSSPFDLQWPPSPQSPAPTLAPPPQNTPSETSNQGAQ